MRGISYPELALNIEISPHPIDTKLVGLYFKISPFLASYTAFIPFYCPNEITPPSEPLQQFVLPS